MYLNYKVPWLIYVCKEGVYYRDNNKLYIYDLLDDIYSIFKLSAAQKNNMRK